MVILPHYRSPVKKIPARISGTYVGRAVLNRLPEKVFRIGLQAILTLIALRLLYAAATTVWG